MTSGCEHICPNIPRAGLQQITASRLAQSGSNRFRECESHRSYLHIEMVSGFLFRIPRGVVQNCHCRQKAHRPKDGNEEEDDCLQPAGACLLPAVCLDPRLQDMPLDHDTHIQNHAQYHLEHCQVSQKLSQGPSFHNSTVTATGHLRAALSTAHSMRWINNILYFEQIEKQYF